MNRDFAFAASEIVIWANPCTWYTTSVVTPLRPNDYRNRMMPLRAGCGPSTFSTSPLGPRWTTVASSHNP